MPNTPDRRTYALAHILAAVILICATLCASGCSNTGYLTGEEKLYTGASLRLEKKGDIPDEGSITGQLEKLMVPSPNGKFLGLFRLKLWLHNVGLFGESMGEPPVLLETVQPDRVATRMRSLLENKGYFQADVSYQVLEEEKTGEVEYTVRIHPPYTIGSVTVRGDDTPLMRSLRATMNESVLKGGDPYDLGKIQQERVRIDAALKEKGYFYFSPDLIQFQADSTAGGRSVDLTMGLRTRITPEASRVFLIGDVYVYSGYALNRDSLIVSAGDTVVVGGYHYIDIDGRFTPETIVRSIFFTPGFPYTRSDHDRTLNRLMNLGVFKFVNIRFARPDSGDGNLIDAHIYLTPLMMKTLRFELQGVSKSNDLAGPVLDVSFRNKNMFSGAELFKLSVEAGFEANIHGGHAGASAYTLGARAELEVPKFLSPVELEDRPSRFVPKTRMLLGVRVVERLEYYQLASVDASFGYLWNESMTIQHEFNPVAVTIARLTGRTQKFEDLLAANQFLRKSFEEQFIIGHTYSITYTDQLEKERKNHLYIKGTVDLSGGLVHLVQSLFRKEKGTPDHPYAIFGLPYSEYSRFDVDLRQYYNSADQTSSLASRIIAGIGIAHGNSSTLPYVKQFFIGGANSIRAFDARSLGPGSYRMPDSLRARSFVDQAADIKLEANVEYRFPIAGIVRGALFLDAGNIWTRQEDPNRPGAAFSGPTFLSEIAVGTGAGVRLDLSFFVLRVDLAFPLRVPSLPDGERWVVNRIDFGSSSWRKENLVLNIAIGYPY